MADGKFVVGQIGARFVLKVEEDTIASGHIPFDLNGAEVSDVDMVFKTPDRPHRLKTVTGTVVPTATDEVEFITTDALFLDVDGVWRYRALITTTDGDTFPTKFASEQVIV